MHNEPPEWIKTICSGGFYVEKNSPQFLNIIIKNFLKKSIDFMG